ncbi:regulator [Comamonas thiooxydans]|uniref:type II toxin-antitoxin system PrlF family antitoxin n=1 Tax=Comamonas thiooxydans TaxID=363952 RepID=UPI0007C47CE8|nr:type II toxin-antitoxin system PrlF family antitoxin [Comamonas thiooxydans]OAD84784.1 regulator [Comamonas thiooxydans]
MAATSKVESTLTERYQTTIPASVRRVLRLNKRDKVSYEIRSNGEVILTRADAATETSSNPAQFLDELAQDISSHPERLHSFEAEAVKRSNMLVRGVKVDLEKPLLEEEE